MKRRWILTKGGSGDGVRCIIEGETLRDAEETLIAGFGGKVTKFVEYIVCESLILKAYDRDG